MTDRAAVDWTAFEKRLDDLFTTGCDPYQAGAAALFIKAPEAITQDDRDLVKRVFMRIAAARGKDLEQPLRDAADLFHEIGSALAAEDLIADCRNAVLADKLRENLRTRVQLGNVASSGFELCTRGFSQAVMTVLDRRHGMTSIEDALQRGAHLFHEIKLAIGVDVDAQNNLVVPSLLHQKRTPAQLRSISADGFEMCVRALAVLGAKDVTIHECGEQALGEQPWDDHAEAATCTGTLVHDEFTTCPVHDLGESNDPMRCTGSRVHGEYTACPVHDRRSR